jgi:hypothetical protein
MQHLTPKQARFVDEYLVDLNGAAAAERAGYGRAGAKVTAHRLTHANRAVQAEIQTRQARDRQRLGIARQDVILGLMEAIAEAKTQGDAAAMISGWTQIGKLMGLFAQQRTVDVGMDSLAALECMSDSELAAFAKVASV